jgi:hypothetical protein
MISANLPSSTSLPLFRLSLRLSQAPLIPPSDTIRPTPIYVTSEPFPGEVTNATKESLGISGSRYGCERYRTAGKKRGAPVNSGGGRGLCSCRIGRGGCGSGRESKYTANH